MPRKKITPIVLPEVSELDRKVFPGGRGAIKVEMLSSFERDADGGYVITYRVKQFTTAPDDKILDGANCVSQRFLKELRLQYGQSVDITVFDPRTNEYHTLEPAKKESD